MAQEETANTRVDPLGDDDAVELAEQYRTERQTERVADLEAIREKYQVPAEIELLLSMLTERPSDARPGEFALYEEALKGGLRLPLPQVVVDVLNRLEVAPGQLMPNAWKIVLACANVWPKANEGAAMTIDEFFACYKASGQQETWINLQAAAGKGLVAGVPSSIKGWRPRWFYVSASGGVGVRTIWKVPTKSMEPKLGAAAEEIIKKAKAWRENEGLRWDELVQPSALFVAGLGPQSNGGHVGRAELEARRKVQEAEDKAMLAKATKFKEAQEDRPPKPIARERIRPRPKPLGGKDLGSFVPQPPPVNPMKEQANKEGEALKKKKKKKRSAPEGAADVPRSKKAKVGGEDTPMVKEAENEAVEETPGRVAAQEVVEVTPALEVVEVAPAVVEIALRVAKVASEVQAEGGAIGPEPMGGGQSQGSLAPQGGG
ncbi:uncharacterized protein LOC114314353 [Camellia sinensis]|uniref:uncharacterized protein LOC114314353 n=1 Tax=Camellia sinensis TaxID=4442 RepID=UPI001036DB0D|nr:uncharacterized protein LOC114314353 [Camellia sinensis]